MIDKMEPMIMPIISAIDNQTYSRNLIAERFVESIFIAHNKNKNAPKDIPNKYLDSLPLSSPKASIARPPARDNPVKEINKFLSLIHIDAADD